MWSAYTVEPYDLILDLRPILLRVQCKWAVDVERLRSSLLSQSTKPQQGLLRRLYTVDEIDAFAAYCAAVDTCYLLPIAQFAGRTTVQLRLGPTRNNQAMGINWAKDFEFAATLSRLQGP